MVRVPVDSRAVVGVALATAAFGFIGWFTGYMIGVSSTPVVGPIVPVVLGAFLAAMLARDGSMAPDERMLVSACVLIFGVLCFLGIGSGADRRRETLDLRYDPPKLSGEAVPAGPGDATDPKEIEARRKPITDLVSRWKIYLVSRRLNLTKREYQGLIQLWSDDQAMGASQWDDFDGWLQKFAESGQLRAATGKGDDEVLGGPRGE